MLLLPWGPDWVPGPWMFSLVDTGAEGWAHGDKHAELPPRWQDVDLPASVPDVEHSEARAAVADTVPLLTATSGNPSSSPLCLRRSNPPYESRFSPDCWPQSAGGCLHAPLTPSQRRGAWITSLCRGSIFLVLKRAPILLIILRIKKKLSLFLA